MHFKKTVAGISAAAIAVTQVAAVVPMGAFAATEQPVKSNVGFALKLTSKNGGVYNYDGVYRSADDKNAVLGADAITASGESTDLAFSYGGLITDGDIKAGDKYTFTADGLTIVANEKDKTAEDVTTDIFHGPKRLYEDRINVENAGNADDVVTITYTKGDSDIKVVDANGAGISPDTSTDGTFTFTLTADSASKFAILGGIEVSSVEVTKTKTTHLADIDFRVDESSQTVTIPADAVIGDKNTVTVSVYQQFFASEAPPCQITATANGNSILNASDGEYTFDLDSDISEFTLTGTNGAGSVELKSSTTTDLNISGTIAEPFVISGDKFASIKVGDKIGITHGAGYGGGPIVISTGENELTYTSDDSEPGYDHAVVTVDTDNIDSIKTNGIAFSGAEERLTRVDIISKGEATEGQEVVLFNSDEPVVWSQTWMDGGYWAGEQSIDAAKISDNIGTIEAFEDNYENVTATWKNLTATKLVLDKGELWAGENTFGSDWSSTSGDWTHVGKTAVKKGGKIIVEYKDASNGQIMLKKSDYNEFSGSLESALSTNGAKGSLEFALDADAAAEISANGFVVGGGSMTITSVKYEAPIEKKIDINSKNFPDTNFQKVLKTFSSDGKTLSESDIEKITKLDCDETEQAALKNVKNFKGIENLTALEYLYISGNTNVTAIDLSKNENLYYFYAQDSKKLANMKLPDGMETIFVSNTAITELNTDSFANLRDLDVSRTKITDIDVSKNTALAALYIHNTKITDIDISANTALKRLDVTSTKITDLDVSANTALEEFYVSDINITDIDVSANTALWRLVITNTKITDLDVSANTALEELYVSDNQLTSLDLSGLTNLIYLAAENNVRNIGEVVDGDYDLADLIKEGLNTENMTIKTEGVTLTKDNHLTGIMGDVEYTYKTGSSNSEFETVTFTLAPEKITKGNFYVSDGTNSVVCETWNDVLKAMNDKNVDYTIMVMNDVNVDKLTFPTAAKAKSVTFQSNTGSRVAIRTKSTSASLPIDVSFYNVGIEAVDNNGNPSKNFTLSASKNLTAYNFDVNAEKAVIKGGAKSVLTLTGDCYVGAEITGFGTVAIDDGRNVYFDKTVKAQNLKLGSMATAAFGTSAATFTNIESGDLSSITYTTADYKPVSVTGNITGDVLDFAIYYQSENSSDSNYTDTFAKGDVVLVSKTANLANISVKSAVPSGSNYTVGRVGSNITVMDTVFTMRSGYYGNYGNEVKYAQWSDALDTIAANAKADKENASDTVYNVHIYDDLNVNGTFKTPSRNTCSTLNIEGDPSKMPAIKFTGNISITCPTWIENIKLDSVKKVNGAETSVDFSISSGKNELDLYNVKSGANIKSITSNFNVFLSDITVSSVNAAAIIIKPSHLNAIDSYGALVDGKWEGSAIKDSSVTVTGNLTAKDELALIDGSSLTVKGVVNSGGIYSNYPGATLVVYKQAKGKNALVIGKNGFFNDYSTNDCMQIKFVLADPETGKTAQITEDLVLGTIAGSYADQFVPSDDNLAETDSYRIIKDSNKLIAVPKEKDQKEYLVKVEVNGKDAYYKSLDAAIKDISATGSSTDEVVITVKQDMFGDSIAKLPLPTAGKYGTLTYTAESAVEINVTSDLVLTGDLVIDKNVVINKVDKNGKVLPISLNIGKYDLTVNGDSFSLEESQSEDQKWANNQIANINGTGTINADNVIFDITGKANGAKVVLTKSTIMLSGKTAGFAGSIESDGYDSAFFYDKSLSKNVKFNTLSGAISLIVSDGDKFADVENTTLASITGDYTGDEVLVNADKTLKVVRSGNTLKAVKAENVVSVEARPQTSDGLFDSENTTTRLYDSVASAATDISRINQSACYIVTLQNDDTLTLPRAKTYSLIEFDSSKKITLTTARDITLTGDVNINEDITVVKTNGTAISVNIGAYRFWIEGKIAPDTDGISQFNNISGKGEVVLMNKSKINGTFNAGELLINDDIELSSKSTFNASEINVIKSETSVSLKYPIKIAKNVKIGKIGLNRLNLSIDDVKEGDQVAALTGDYYYGTILINGFDPEEAEDTNSGLVAARSGSKLMAVKFKNLYGIEYHEDDDYTVIICYSYADVIAEINRINDPNGGYIIYLPANTNITKLTLPAKGKYNALGLYALNDDVTLKLTSDVALTGNLYAGYGVTLQKNGGTSKDILKFTSPKGKDNKPIYSVETDGGYIVNGTLNGEKIDSPEKPVVENVTLPYTNKDGFDLSNNNKLKIAKTEVEEGGIITITTAEEVSASSIKMIPIGNDLSMKAAHEDGTKVYSYIISDYFAERITKNGFTVSGSEGKVTSITYTAPKKSIVDGTIPYTNAEGLDLSAKKLRIAEIENAEEGSVITLTFNGDFDLQVNITKISGEVMTTIYPEPAKTTYTWLLTADDANCIQADGFIVEGEGGMLTGVTYKEAAEAISVTFLPWSGSSEFDADGYGSVLEVQKELITVSNVTTVTVKFTANADTYAATITNNWGKVLATTGKNSSLTLTLTKEQSQNLFNEGFKVKGKNVTITEISFTADTDAGPILGI